MAENDAQDGPPPKKQRTLTDVKVATSKYCFEPLCFSSTILFSDAKNSFLTLFFTEDAVYMYYLTINLQKQSMYI